MKQVILYLFTLAIALTGGCSSVTSGISTTADGAVWTADKVVIVSNATYNGVGNLINALTPERFVPTEQDIDNAKEVARDILAGSQVERRVFEGSKGSIIVFKYARQDEESMTFNLEEQANTGKSRYAIVYVALGQLRKEKQK